MADKNILIGIGGSGAKIVEAFVHLCAAGLGPTEVEVGFAEQDRANGNLSRTVATLSRYLAVQRTLRKGETGHGIRPASPFAVTTVKPLGVEDRATLTEQDIRGCVWVPHPAPKQTLKGIFDFGQMEPDLQNLFQTLYDPSTELGMELDDGYQGRPHLGTLAMRSATTGAFWNDIEKAIERAEGGGTNIFLAGSIFGGTGAAGFPTLARYIRTLKEKKRMRNVRVSGVLMLPYFSFGPDEDKNSVAVQSSELLEQTKVSLEYYSSLLGTQKVFDDLYLIGWSPYFHLPYNEKGNNQQCNPPLAPELLAALATARAFNPVKEANYDDAAQHIRSCARAATNQLNWLDLPPIEGNRGSLQQAVGQWLRFAFAWKYIFRQALERNLRGQPREQWFRLYADQIDFDAENIGDELGAIDQYADSALHWAAGMAHWSARRRNVREDAFSFNLWQADRIATEVQLPYCDVALRLPRQVHYAALDDLVVLGNVQGEPDTAESLFEQLSSGASKVDGSRGIGKLVDAIFQASALRATQQQRRQE